MPLNLRFPLLCTTGSTIVELDVVRKIQIFGGWSKKATDGKDQRENSKKDIHVKNIFEVFYSKIKHNYYITFIHSSNICLMIHQYGPQMAWRGKWLSTISDFVSFDVDLSCSFSFEVSRSFPWSVIYKIKWPSNKWPKVDNYLDKN